MGSGQAHGINREYQVLARDVLIRQAMPRTLVPIEGDGIDVAIELGTAVRRFDVALVDSDGCRVVAECKRTADPVELVDLDAFAYRVELLRSSCGMPVAGVYFAKTGYRSGSIKGAQDAGITVAICAQAQDEAVFALMFEKYDVAREERLRDATVLVNRGFPLRAKLGGTPEL